MITAVEVHGVATHQEDDVVLSTALSAPAQYLVTGDTKLQKLRTHQDISIVSPREFTEILLQQEQQEQDWAVVDKARQRNADKDPEDVLRDATAEVETAREEVYGEKGSTKGGR